MPKPLIITLKEGIDPVYGLQKVPTPAAKTVFQGQYVLMPRASTYAQGAYALREACKAETDSPHPQFVLDDGSRIYRALTFKEDIEARVKDYESHKDSEDRLRLFQRWNDSCTGMAYKAGTSKFKIVPKCQNLITISEDFNAHFLPISYENISGIELQSDCGKYNQHLTKDEVVNHPAWLTAIENDKALLKAYSDIVFAELRNPETAMAFVVHRNAATDELRALFVSSLYCSSNANGGNLYYGGSFLLVAPSGAPQATRKKITGEQK